MVFCNINKAGIFRFISNPDDLSLLGELYKVGDQGENNITS